MSTQLDWVGDEPAGKPFKDIGNTRPSTAEEKAALALQLGALINRVPKSINAGSYDLTKAWKTDREAACKSLKSPRSSVQELRSAITRMERYK